MSNLFVQLLRDYFYDALEPLEMQSKAIPFAEDLELCVKIVITREDPESSNFQQTTSGYLIQLSLFNSTQTEEFEPMLEEYMNIPVKVNFPDLLSVIGKLKFDYQLPWCLPIRTITTEAQFLTNMLPFFEVTEKQVVERGVTTQAVSPAIIYVPGSVYPEPEMKLKNIQCFLCSYHISENNLRIVISPIQPEEKPTFAPVTVDLEYEKSEFIDLFEQKTQLASEWYGDYKPILDSIAKVRAEKTEDNRNGFRNFLRDFYPPENNKKWMEYQVIHVLSVERVDRAEGRSLLRKRTRKA